MLSKCVASGYCWLTVNPIKLALQFERLLWAYSCYRFSRSANWHDRSFLGFILL